MKQSYSFCTDDRLCINSWGEEISKFTGRPSPEVLGRKYHDVLPRIFIDNRDAVSVAFEDNKSLILKGYCFNCLCDQVKADIKINPVEVDNGKVKEVMVDLCPHSVCSMARKLQNSQRLIDIGKIASTLAHGVRNPLNAIKGSVVYLREKYSDELTLVEFTKIMEEEISRLDNFISRFLSTSVSFSGLSESDVNVLLKKVEIYTSLQTHTNDISAAYEYGDVPLVAIDSFQLEQVVLNVINNAIEAMGSGGHLSVSTSVQKVSDKDFVLIGVSDTGPGMLDNGINDISPENKGRGFGLFITREILQYYGGFLEIKSRKGAGTTVMVYIPVSNR